jgi:hypothetical protein
MSEVKRSLIKNLVLHEISHVSNPANPGARVVLWKKASVEKEGVEPMSPEELQKKVTELETANSVLTKRVETIVTMAKSAGVDVLVNGEAVTVSKTAEPEMIEFEGQRIAKSAIPAVVLEAIEKSRRETAELRDQMEVQAITKRATEMFPHLKGTDAEKAAMLKSVEAIADETVRKSVVESLKAADAAVAKTFEEKGSDHVDETSPKAQLDKLAKTYSEEKGVTFHAAFAEITKSGEGKRLATLMQN